MQSSAILQLSKEEQESEELYDLSVIASLEADIVPLLGESRIPDHVITQLAKVLHQGSRLHDQDIEELDHRGKSPDKTWMGTTQMAQLLPRERFSYWCFDLLFFVCSDVAKGTCMDQPFLEYYTYQVNACIQIMEIIDVVWLPYLCHLY